MHDSALARICVVCALKELHVLDPADLQLIVADLPMLMNISSELSVSHPCVFFAYVRVCIYVCCMWGWQCLKYYGNEQLAST